MSALARLWPFGGNRFGTRMLQTHFKAHGWSIGNQQAWFITFFIRRADTGLIGVCVMPTLPSVGTLSGSHRIADKMQCRLLVITRDPVSDTQRAAFSAHDMTLLDWQDLDRLDTELERTRRRAASEIADARRSVDQSAANTVAPARTLTEAERAAGCVFATSNVFCRFTAGTADSLLIVFAEAPTQSTVPSPRLNRFRAKAPHAVLSVETSSVNWFPHGDMLACLAAIDDLLAERHPLRLALGAAQGGYAALRYGKALGATAALAFSPAFSIDPDIVVDRRHNRTFDASLHTGMRVDAADICDNAVIVFDPHDPGDAAQLAAFPPHLQSGAIAAPFAGHGCPHLARDVNVLLNALTLAQAGRMAPLAAAIAARRHANKARPHRLALATVARHPRTALALFGKYHLAAPSPSWLQTCYRLAGLGMAADVIDWSLLQASARPADAETQATVALIALHAQDHATATALIDRALALQPSNAKFLNIRQRVSDG